MKINKTQKWTVWLALIILIALLFGIVSNTFAAVEPWADNAIQHHEVWDPAPDKLKWVPGQPKGYAEGDTAAFLIKIKVDPDNYLPGDQLYFQICLDYDNSSTPAYAFTDLEPWDTTVQPPPPLPGGVTLSDTNNPFVYAYNATIVSVNFLGRGTGHCPGKFIRWDVLFNVIDPTGDGNIYIVYGGHIAKPGDITILGDTVLADEGASNVNGVYQARVITNSTGAAKTVNFGSTPTAITLVDFGGSSANTQWFGLILLAVMIIVTMSIYGVFRLRKTWA